MIDIFRNQFRQNLKFIIFETFSKIYSAKICKVIVIKEGNIQIPTITKVT
jgi:hypothetical protein